MKSKEFHKIITTNGWKLKRISGSHYIYTKNELTMTTHIIAIEKSKNLFCAYSVNFVGAYGCGKTIEEVKSQALKGYDLYLKENQLPKEKLNIIWKIKAATVKDLRLIREK